MAIGATHIASLLSCDRVCDYENIASQDWQQFNIYADWMISRNEGAIIFMAGMALAVG